MVELGLANEFCFSLLFFFSFFFFFFRAQPGQGPFFSFLRSLPYNPRCPQEYDRRFETPGCRNFGNAAAIDARP